MRHSRFSWETRHANLNNSTNTVKAYFEFDFLGNYDRTSLLLRQFYGQYKNLLRSALSSERRSAPRTFRT